jgi:hypothetical protein
MKLTPEFFYLGLSVRVGQQRHEARALDRGREHPLMLGGSPGDAAGDDLAAFGQEILQQTVVLIVDIADAFRGETAYLATWETPPRTSGTTRTPSPVIAATVILIAPVIAAIAAIIASFKSSIVSHYRFSSVSSD